MMNVSGWKLKWHRARQSVRKGANDKKNSLLSSKWFTSTIVARSATPIWRWHWNKKSSILKMYQPCARNLLRCRWQRVVKATAASKSWSISSHNSYSSTRQSHLKPLKCVLNSKTGWMPFRVAPASTLSSKDSRRAETLLKVAVCWPWPATAASSGWFSSTTRWVMLTASSEGSVGLQPMPSTHDDHSEIDNLD